MEHIKYQGRIVEIIEKEVFLGKTTKTFEIARRSPGVRLIVPKDGKILLSREYRHEVEGYDYRLPGGKVYDSLTEYNTALSNNVDMSESGKQAAVKEAREEVGIEVRDLSHLHTSVCGSTIVWDLLYFVVEDFTVVEQELEDGEDITVEWVDREKVRDMCLDGTISEERSALVLLRYLNNKK